MVQPLGVRAHQRSGEHDCDLFLTAHIPFYHSSETVYLFAGSCKFVCRAWNEAGLPVEEGVSTAVRTKIKNRSVNCG